MGVFKAFITSIARRLKTLSAKQKLISLCAISLISVFVTGLIFLSAVFCFALLLYPLMGYSIGFALKQLRPFFWFISLFFVVQIFTQDWTIAAGSALRMASLLLFSYLLTLTTKTSEMMEMFEDLFSFLKYFSYDPALFSFMLALTLRFIPLFLQILQEVKEARISRGLGNNIFALFVPVLIRVLKIHNDVSLALDARCYPPNK